MTASRYDRLRWATQDKICTCTGDNLEYFTSVLELIGEFEELTEKYNRTERYLEKMRKRL